MSARFVAMQKNGMKGRAFKIWNDRGQLDHLERELVEPLWSFERLQWLAPRSRNVQQNILFIYSSLHYYII